MARRGLALPPIVGSVAAILGGGAMLLTAMLICTGVLAAVPAFAQSKSSDPPLADFKPLIQPILPPLVLPPNSYITPGAVTGDPIPTYSSTPGYDAARSAPAPGLRLTIPTR